MEKQNSIVILFLDAVTTLGAGISSSMSIEQKDGCLIGGSMSDYSVKHTASERQEHVLHPAAYAL